MLSVTDSPGLQESLSQASLNGTVTYEAVRNDEGGIDDFRLTNLNEQALLDFAKPTGEVIQQTVRALFAAADAEFLVRQFTLVVDTGRSVRFDMPFQPISNQPVQLYEALVARADEGGVIVSYSNTTNHLRQQTDLLDRIIRTAPSAIALHKTVYDSAGEIADFQIVKANQLAFDWLRIKPDEAYVNPLSALIPGFLLSETFRSYMRVAETGESTRFERNLGAEWYEFSVAPFDTSILVTVNKTTERKQAELAQQQQTEVVRAMLDAIPSGVFVSEAVRDAEGVIIDFRLVEANGTALRETRSDRSAVVGKLASEVFPYDRQNGVFERYVATVQNRQIQRFEQRVVHQGITIWVDVQLAYLGQDRVLSAFNDITPLKQAQLAFQQQSELLRSVVDNVQVGIGLMQAIRDETGAIVDFAFVMTNEANARITLVPVETMLSKDTTMLNLLPGTVESGFFDTCVTVTKTGQPVEFELHYTFDNLNGWYEIRILKQDDGVLFASSDITKRKEAELAQEQQNQILQRANRDLQLSNENLQQFAYVASHDLQEPLRKIQSFGDLLKERHAESLDPEGVDMLTRMQVASQRMSLLIRDLLTYSRVSTQREPHKTISLNRVVADVVDSLFVAVQESHADLQIAPLPDTTGDASQLRQLFQNLLSNAIKFRHPNTSPLIRVDCQTLSWGQVPADVHPAFAKRGSVVEISIADNGIGFDTQYAERIFQVFQRLHGRNKYAGSGIGLAICRRVAENHGGTITAHGTPGQGATFRVYLPA